MYARECHSLVPFAATKTTPRNAETGQPKCQSDTAESRLGHFTGASECPLAKKLLQLFPQPFRSHTYPQTPSLVPIFSLVSSALPHTQQ
jgi:hypothetical protein